MITSDIPIAGGLTAFDMHSKIQHDYAQYPISQSIQSANYS